MRLATMLTVAVWAAGCGSSHSTRADGDASTGDASTDAGPVLDETPADGVTVLFVVDNSGSMTEEIATLAIGLPAFVDRLAGIESVERVKLGVVTTDMGTGGFTVPSCSEPDFGDDGILSTRGDVYLTGCSETYPSITEWRADSTRTTEEVAEDFHCVVYGVSTGGCGFEQHLEAGLKAVTPSTSSIRFFRDTTGHGDGANEGLVEPRDVLAVVVLSDEEDCSLADPELINPASSVYTGNLNLRCHEHPEAVHPVDRYAEGLLALRPAGRRLVFAPIAGVPTDLIEDDASYDEILGDERMQERIDPDDPNRLRPSCNVPGRGLAFPPRRMVTLAQKLEAAGAHTTAQSVCQSDYSHVMDAIASRIEAAASDPWAER